MKRGPLITLTTDFGTQDGYVGAMKGRIHSRVPDARIVDISHQIAPQDVWGGAWCIRRAVPHYPPGTIHVVVVDPGVGSERAPLLLEWSDQWLIGPDNGVLSLVGNEPPDTVYQLHRETRWWEAHRSFDGLALFTPAACCLALGHDPGELGVRQLHYERLRVPSPRIHGDTLHGQVLCFDRFGNAITNISTADLEGLPAAPRSAGCAGQQFPLCDCYSQAAPGTAAAIINSDGLLELSCVTGSAKAAFGLQSGAEVELLAPARA